jgi:septal ring-binding cell division protein DamX
VTAPRTRRPFDWEAAGEELGDTLSSYHMIVVAGADSVTTGRVAVGIARMQSLHRRVAVGDLFAESPPIRELVQTDDPHGLVDSFLYGVSLSRIAYPVAGPGELFAMQSGSEPPVYEEMLPNARWHRLCGGFREAGALLVLAVPASAPHIEDLVAAADGAVLVADADPGSIPFSRIIASVREPRDDAKGPVAHTPSAAAAAPWWKGRSAAVSGVLLTIVIIATGLWLAYRPLAHTPRPVRPKPDTTKGLGQVITPTADSATRPAGADSAAAVAPAIPHVVNPADSTTSAVFAVELMKANTQAGAILKLQKDGAKLPAATFAPVMIQGVRWFRVLSGAYANRADADSLLVSLRRQNVLDAGRGSVVQVPFAFRIDSGVPATAVAPLIATYTERGEPVYALRQSDGKAWLLTGAFETIEQSMLYAESLRTSGITAVLVYRKGGTF